MNLTLIKRVFVYEKIVHEQMILEIVTQKFNKRLILVVFFVKIEVLCLIVQKFKINLREKLKYKVVF